MFNESNQTEKAWYRKYRPTQLSEYSDEFLVRTVNARFRDRHTVPQIVLLYGTYGCGKTTLARILSQYYLCSNPNPDGTPCGQCGGCKMVRELIADGSGNINSECLLEINASEKNKVDDIKQLIREHMLIPPMLGGFKVIILDECHRLTSEAQNVMLKILEDTPGHLVVLFATTEPEKLLPTVYSRCQLKMEVKRQSERSMTEILLNIAKQERIKTEKQALRLISSRGGRIPRDCVNLMQEIVMASGGDALTSNAVLEYLGGVAYDRYVEFINASRGGLESLMLFIAELSGSEITEREFLTGFARFAIDCLNVRMAVNLNEYDASFIKSAKEVFKAYRVNEFNLLLEHIAWARSVPADTLAITLLGMRIGSLGQAVSEAVKNPLGQAEAENEISRARFAELRDSGSESKNSDDTQPIDAAEFMTEFLSGFNDAKLVGGDCL